MQIAAIISFSAYIFFHRFLGLADLMLVNTHKHEL